MAKANPKKSLLPVKEELVLTPEEIQAILAIRERGAVQMDPIAEDASVDVEPKLGVNELASALVTAIEATRPPQKKTVANRKRGTPWTPKDGSPKITKLRRPAFHHGIEIEPKRHTNEVCALLDKVRPGLYLDGFVRVVQRRDKSIDIDYPCRTNSQRLRLVNEFGIASFQALLERILDEKANPTKYRRPEDLD